MKLDGFVEVEAKIKCLTGCRIGGTESGFEIGGIDNPILRNPLNGLPYIPGSSLKGKIRSLLELKHNKVYQDERKRIGAPCQCGKEDCFVCSLFGCGDARNIISPTRLIFRDSFMDDESIKTFGKIVKDYAEVKTEVKIDRNTSTSADPRENYRIPAGTNFDMQISIRIFSGDKRFLSDWIGKLAEGFDLLECDYLGGSGTRGYGKVAFRRDGMRLSDYLRSDDFKKKIGV
jgi:CRISPR-associated protein Csm3